MCVARRSPGAQGTQFRLVHDHRGRGQIPGEYVSSIRLRALTISNRLFIVPVNLKEEDAFHLTIEEYLLALIAMVEELV